MGGDSVLDDCGHRSPPAEAERELRRAEHEGLVFEEIDESRNVRADFNRQVWLLTDPGREELRRLEDEPRAE